MKTLYWYVLRGFLSSWLICLFSIVGLFIVVDLSARLGDFVQAQRPDLAAYILSYYLFNIPLIFGKVSPLITVLAAISVMTKMKKSNELTPVTASGISIQNILAPVIVFAGIMSFAGLAMEEWVFPAFSRMLRERDLSVGWQSSQFYSLVRDRENGMLFFIVHYKPSQQLMENAYISRVDSKLRETEHIYAKRARFDKGIESWVLEEGQVQRFDERGYRAGSGRPEKFETKVLEGTSVLPFDVEKGGDTGGVRPLSDLYALWRHDPQMTGLGVRFHFRAAFPFANLVLLLVALPFTLRSRSHSFFLGALLSAAVVAAFFGLGYLFLKLGDARIIPPIFAGWIPLAFFGSAGSVLFRLIPT